MSNKDLYSQEALEKLKELAESIDFAMMATDLSQPPFHIIPMSTKKVDKEGSIWFLSNRNSTHNRHIEEEERVLLTYSDKGNMEFLSVYGQALIKNDKTIIKELYGSGDDAWFDGVEDPNITAIQVRPSEAHYWDTKDGKLISLFKMAIGSVTGNEPDLGEEGKLKL